MKELVDKVQIAESKKEIKKIKNVRGKCWEVMIEYKIEGGWEGEPIPKVLGQFLGIFKVFLRLF